MSWIGESFPFAALVAVLSSVTPCSLSAQTVAETTPSILSAQTGSAQGKHVRITIMDDVERTGRRASLSGVGQDTPVQQGAQLSPVTVSFGAGPIVTGYHLIEGAAFLVNEPSALMGSVGVRLRRSLFLEGEVTYASSALSWARTFADTTFVVDEAMSQTSVVGNLVVPVGTAVPRVSTFLGGGGGVRATSTHLDTLLSCAPRAPTGCEGRPDVQRRETGTAFAPLLQVSYGIDVLVQPRLSGFAALRWPFEPGSDDDNDLTGFGVTGGVRLGLGGKIVETSDGRTGERAPSRLRTGTMLGLVGGGIVGGIWAYRSSGDDTRGAAPLVMSLYGVGIGAGVGALLDAAR